MNDAPDPDQEPTAAPYLRLPVPLVAAGLFIFLIGLLGFGLYANRNLRPQGIVVPTVAPEPTRSTPAVVAAPTSTLPTTPLVPDVASVPTPLIPNLALTPTALRPASTVATTLAGTPGGSNAATPVPTLDPALVAEVTSAFDKYWQIRTQALLDLDTTHLSEVMAGDHLQGIARRIDELRAENRAIQTNVDHDIHVVEVSLDSARIIDDYISDSVYVDPATKEKLTEPASDELRVLYLLRKIEGSWKVIDSVVQA